MGKNTKKRYGSACSASQHTTAVDRDVSKYHLLCSPSCTCVLFSVFFYLFFFFFSISPRLRLSLSFSVHSDCFWAFPIRLTCFLSSLLALRHFTQLSLFLDINRFPYFFFFSTGKRTNKKEEKRSVEFVFHIPSSLSLKNKKEKLNLRLSFFFFFYCCLLLLLLVRLGRFSVRRVSFFFFSFACVGILPSSFLITVRLLARVEPTFLFFFLSSVLNRIGFL